MAALIRKEKGAWILTSIAKLTLVLIFISLAASFIETVWSVYIDGFVHSASLVGFISSIFTIVAFFSYFWIIPMIERSNKTKLVSISLIVFAIAYFLFAINSNFYFFLLIALVITIFGTIRITSFGIIIRDCSEKTELSRNEGILYTFLNIAWAVGPLIAGYISDVYGINRLFMLGSVFMLVAFFFFQKAHMQNDNVKKKIDGSIIKNFLDFFKSKDRRIAYFLGGGVNLWFVLIYIFTPLFIIMHGLHIRWVGYFLAAFALIPISLEYFFSKLAGKVGFRKIFHLGFFILFISGFLAFFFSNVYIVLGILLFSSFGISMTEPTTEAYFFDVLKRKEALRFYGPYNTTINVNMFIGEILSAVFLLFLPFKYVFIMFAGFMFLLFLLTFKAKKIIEEKRR